MNGWEPTNFQFVRGILASQRLIVNTINHPILVEKVQKQRVANGPFRLITKMSDSKHHQWKSNVVAVIEVKQYLALLKFV